MNFNNQNLQNKQTKRTLLLIVLVVLCSSVFGFTGGYLANQSSSGVTINQVTGKASSKALLLLNVVHRS